MASLRRVFPRGEVFNQGKLDKVIQELRRQYYANGKYGAQVDYEISPVERMQLR